MICNIKIKEIYLREYAKISVNRIIVREPEFHVDGSSDEILVDGKPLTVEQNAYFMMNKASGAVCSTKSDRRKTVFEYIFSEDNRKYPGGNLSTVGRLDADTEGLLIITSDGNLIHRVTFPKYEVPNLLPKIEIGDSSKIVLYSTVELMSCEIHIRSASFSTFL